MDPIKLLGRLEAAGLRPDRTLRGLCAGSKDEALMAAFTDVMGCDFCLEGYDHGLEFVPPGLVPIAHVGNGDFYGLYVYPPAEATGAGPPVVQFLHEIPCVEYEAPNTTTWLLEGIDKWQSDLNSQGELAKGDQGRLLLNKLQLGALRDIDKRKADLPLPTEQRIESLDDSQLAEWLLRACPPKPTELLTWEAAWVCWWTHGRCNGLDGLEQEALLDFGIEVYEQLGWKLHALALEDAARLSGGISREDRQQRALNLWCRVNSPSQADLPPLTARLALGDDDADSIFRYWREAYGWLEVEMCPNLRTERAVLGSALVNELGRHTDAKERERIERAILLYELEELLDALVSAKASREVIHALAALKESHAKERKVIADANDWSDV